MQNRAFLGLVLFTGASALSVQKEHAEAPFRRKLPVCLVSVALCLWHLTAKRLALCLTAAVVTFRPSASALSMFFVPMTCFVSNFLGTCAVSDVFLQAM